MSENIYDPHHGAPCDCDWDDPKNWNAKTLAHRVLPPPDQTRYGTATTDPLGRDAPGWRKGSGGLPVKVKAGE